MQSMTADVQRHPQTSRSQRTRHDLSRAAYAHLAAEGTLDVAAVVAAAGVSAATFYAHFATHDDALAAALDIALQRVVGVGEQDFRIENLLNDGVDAVVGQLVEHTHDAFRSDSLVFRAAIARLPGHRGIRDIYRHHEAKSLAHFTDQITLGQKASLLDQGDPRERALALLVVLQGMNNPLLTKGPLAAGVSAHYQRALRAVLQS